MKVLSFALGEMRTNTYFCFDSDSCVVIDPGMDGEGIYRKLCEKNLVPTHILLTHGHFDHSQSVRDLALKTGAKIAVHELDADMLVRPSLNGANFYYHGNLEGYPTVSPDLLFRDGDVLTCGSLSFRVIHTPGHTPGSVCFAARDVLFCGDTVFAYGFGRYDLWGGDRLALSDSLEKIASLPEDYKLCPGHGNSATLARTRSAIFGFARELKNR